MNNPACQPQATKRLVWLKMPDASPPFGEKRVVAPSWLMREDASSTPPFKGRCWQVNTKDRALRGGIRDLETTAVGVDDLPANREA